MIFIVFENFNPWLLCLKCILNSKTTQQAFSQREKDALFSGRQANPKDLLRFSRQ